MGVEGGSGGVKDGMGVGVLWERFCVGREELWEWCVWDRRSVGVVCVGWDGCGAGGVWDMRSVGQEKCGNEV